MKEDIDSVQKDLVATEEVCALENPSVIREYLSASDEDKQLFEMTFKAFKTNTQLVARGEWYDWKMGLMERIRPVVDKTLVEMQEVSNPRPVGHEENKDLLAVRITKG